MRRSLKFSLTVMLCAASTVAAQDVSALIAGDHDASVELAGIIRGAQLKGLPVEPILTKVRYAVNVVHAPPQRTIAAVKAMVARLEEARKALAPAPTDLEIIAGQDALSANVSSKTLREIRAASGTKPMAMSLGVLAQLVTDSIPEARAARIVTNLIKHGATDRQLMALGNDVNADVATGKQAALALDLRMNRLNAVLGIPVSATGDAAASQPTTLQPKKP